MKLQGKAALVTGSNRGIGKATALRLAQDGADVIIHFEAPHHEGEADDVMTQIGALGVRAKKIRADISTIDGCHGLLDASFQAFDHLSILVNNAGVEKKTPFDKITEADFDFVLNVNLKGAFFCAQGLVRGLAARKRPGKIINISSVHENLPFPGFASYCVSKGGLRMLARTLAVELAPLHITINNVAPGAIATPINEKLLHNQTLFDDLIHKIPLGRLGKPEDVAGLVAFLASDDAAYITGASYVIDGGLTKDYHEQ